MKNSFSGRAFLAATLFVLTVFMVATKGQLLAQEYEDNGPKDGSDLREELLSRMQKTEEPTNFSQQTASPCIGGMADIYACNEVDLLSQISHPAMGGGTGNDIWGWTDPLNGDEYALVGSSTGTSFVDVSDPINPIYLGRLPSHNGASSTWRDMKVYANYAFIVADGNNGHGMQIFDLTQLRNVPNPPVTFSNTAHYSQIQDAHNVVINEQTGYAYIVGGTNNCSGGLHMVDISNPLSASFVGCFDADGYTHDAQCVIYTGPDVAHQGQEICFNSNEDTLTIADVSNKAAPAMLSSMGYAGTGYTHQGWLTEDHTYFLLGDELDESNFGHNTRTYIWDVSDLDSPMLIGNYTAVNASIDHNMYVKDDHVFQSNYSSGLRILDISDVATATLTEEAFFDTYPANNSVNFSGQWSNYPYFESGIIIVNDRQNGLFVLWPTSIEPSYAVAISPDEAAMEWAGETVTYTVSITNTGDLSDTYDLSVSGNVWPTTLSTNSVFLVDGASSSFEVYVEIPASAANGESDGATVTAVSQNSTIGVNASTNLTTTAIASVYSLTLVEDQAAEVMPGESVTYTVWLTNTGNVTDSYDIMADGVWTTAVSTSTITLAPGEGAPIWLWAEVPADALYGEMDTAVLTATSNTDPSATASVSLTTSAAAIYAMELQAMDPAQSSEPGNTVTYTIWLTNTGNVTDTYDLMTSGIWATDLSVSSITLAPGVATSFEVGVTIPAEALNGDLDMTTVTAESQTSTNTIDAFLITTADVTVAPTFTIYLPYVQNDN